MRSLEKKMARGGMPGHGKGAYGEEDVCFWKFFPEAAHDVHVGGALHHVDDVPCGEEEQGFDEGVRGEVEHRCVEGSGPQARNIITQLAHRGIGQTRSSDLVCAMAHREANSAVAAPMHADVVETSGAFR